MIAYIEGSITEMEPTHVIMDVQGVGYLIRISLNTYSAIKEQRECRIFTHLHIKEDAHTLYGFADQKERQIFLNLLGISGVGPATCLMILSSLGPEELQQAIGNEDLHAIQSIKGIGSKTAQRIILELKDKMRKDELVEKSVDLSDPTYNTIRNEALTALVTLGFNKSVAEKNITTILKREQDISLEDLIKLALKTN